MLLIHPPVAKPCEPPAGIARIAAALQQRGIECTVLDAGIEGLLHLLDHPRPASDRWSLRAIRNTPKNLSFLKQHRACHSIDRYKRAVSDLTRAVEVAAGGNAHLSLANYQSPDLSPVRSRDAIRAAENPDGNPFFPYLSKRLRALLHHRQPRMVGFSLNFLSQVLCTFAMIGFMRRECPGLPIILGGGLVTSWMSRPGWKNPFDGLVDTLVSGPGEGPLLELLGFSGADVDCTLPGYRPLPLEDYLAPGRIVPYSASTGCYWNNCSFCPERAEGNPYRPIPPGRVVRDLGELSRSLSPSLFHLLDNALSPSLMEALCGHPPGAPWYGFARVTRHLADEDFCRSLRRSGCVMLKLGLESGDQDVIDREQKGIDLETASLALRSLKRAGIGTYVYLLFGTPAETAAKARKTLDFTVRHSDVIDFLNLAIFNMPIHSPDTRFVDTNPFSEGDLSLYTGFSHPSGWDRGLVRQFLDKEFKRHPAVAAILRNDPPTFTSNHAPFFCMPRNTGRRVQ
ncbi:MAG: radical SAM protein [Desulfobacteraceae bacterium]|nr:radical SAM protein [Desulfobacteraceae bacterium]